MNTFDMALNIKPAAPQTAKPAPSKESSEKSPSDFHKALKDTLQSAKKDQAQHSDEVKEEVVDAPETPEVDETANLEQAAAWMAMMMPMVLTPEEEQEVPQTVLVDALTAVEDDVQMVVPQQMEATVVQSAPMAQKTVQQPGAVDVSEMQVQQEQPAMQVKAETAAQVQEAPKQVQETSAPHMQRVVAVEDDVTADVSVSMQADRPLFGKVESTPVQVGAPVRADAPDFTEQLSARIDQMLEQGKNTIEVKLAPRELGTITIRISTTMDGTLVSLHSENAKTMALLSEHAANIGAIVERSQPGQVSVRVEHDQPDQQPQQDQQQERQGGQQQQQQHSRRQSHPQDDDFIQQFRLGLIGLANFV